MDDQEPYNGPATGQELPAENIKQMPKESSYGDTNHNLSRPAPTGTSCPLTGAALDALGAGKAYGDQ